MENPFSLCFSLSFFSFLSSLAQPSSNHVVVMVVVVANNESPQEPKFLKRNNFLSLNWNCGSERLESTPIIFLFLIVLLSLDPWCRSSCRRVQQTKESPASLLTKRHSSGVIGSWKAVGRTWNRGAWESNSIHLFMSPRAYSHTVHMWNWFHLIYQRFWKLNHMTTAQISDYQWGFKLLVR